MKKLVLGIWTAGLIIASGSVGHGSDSDHVGAAPAAAGYSAAWVAQRVADWQPTPQERAFYQIGWAESLGQALQLSQQHKRPIFLFTYDGASLSGFRC